MVRLINLERGRQACPGSEGRVDVRFSDGMFHGCVCTTRAAYAVPAHVPSGAALAALMLSEEARGVRGLDVLRRSVDRAPPIAA